MFNNNLNQKQNVQVTIFSLEILIDTKSNKVSYNQNILPGKLTQTSTGGVMMYDCKKGMNVPIPCNNKDMIHREEIQDGEYIRYHVNCTKPRIEEFKEELVKYVRSTESALHDKYEQLVASKQALLTELDTYLEVSGEANEGE